MVLKQITKQFQLLIVESRHNCAMQIHFNLMCDPVKPPPLVSSQTCQGSRRKV